MADSAAAIVSIIIVNICPNSTSKKDDPIIKSKEAAKRVNSTDIINSIKLVLLREIPKIPSMNKINEVIINDFILILVLLLTTRRLVLRLV